MNKVLLVEDENDLRKIIANYLKQANFTVVEAADGEQALSLFADGEYDLVILKNGYTDTSISYMKIEAVPAYNTTPGRDKYHPRHRDNGYILTFDGLRVYIAGDTEDIPEMKDLKDIDIAFLPVNQPYTMTVPQAAKAAKMFSPKILYPYHYGDTKIGELKDALKDSGIDVRIRELQ